MMRLTEIDGFVESNSTLGQVRYEYEFADGTKATVIRSGEDERGRLVYSMIYKRPRQQRVIDVGELDKSGIIDVLTYLQEGECTDGTCRI